MRLVIQRVSHASVTVDDQIVGRCGVGFCILAGVKIGDTPAEARWLANKVANLRVFEDDAGKMNLSLLDVKGEALVVSQFTLYADAQRGRRPDFIAAARPEQAEPLIESFVEQLRAEGVPTQTGVFRAIMHVEIHNDGPVTILLEKEPEITQVLRTCLNRLGLLGLVMLTACANTPAATQPAVMAAPSSTVVIVPSNTPHPSTPLPVSGTPAPTRTARPSLNAKMAATVTPSLTAKPRPANSSTAEGHPDATTAATAPAAVTTTSVPTSAAPPNPPPSAVDATLSPPPEGGSCGKYPCADDIDGWVQRLRVPPGFAVRHVARADGHPTSITYDPTGRLIVATMEGSILAFDTNGHAATIASGFHLPIGLAYRPGSSDLYVASRTFPREAVPNEGKVTLVHADGSQQDIVTGLPCCYTSDMHQPDSLAFGPDGKVYLSIGARADHGETPSQPDVPGELQPLEAGILRFNPDGSDLEKYASGLRNPYDLTFDARGQLFATDNSPDFGPPDRLLRIVPGNHYGYPYYANCQQCPPVPAGITITPPYATFIPHAAAAGIAAYNGSQFPANYRNNLFVTLWSAFTGAQKVVRIQTSPFKMSDFVLGLANPIDVAVTPNGGLAVADWATGNVFEISYAP